MRSVLATAYGCQQMARQKQDLRASPVFIPRIPLSRRLRSFEQTGNEHSIHQMHALTVTHRSSFATGQDCQNWPDGDKTRAALAFDCFHYTSSPGRRAIITDIENRAQRPPRSLVNSDKREVFAEEDYQDIDGSWTLLIIV